MHNSLSFDILAQILGHDSVLSSILKQGSKQTQCNAPMSNVSLYYDFESFTVHVLGVILKSIYIIMNEEQMCIFIQKEVPVIL